MRLLNLQLKAYGSFTDWQLDLSDGAFGVHILYGPNEAGKTTLLQSLEDLLYGIPMRSTQAYLHDMDRLRIGATLQHSSGEILSILRRKGRDNTLLDAHEKPLDPRLLERFLQGVDREGFKKRFGLDHQRLREGGQELLKSNGSLGESLFAAGLGRGVHVVIEALEKEAEERFNPRGRGSRQTINALLTRIDGLKRELQDASVPASTWLQADRNLARAREERSRFQDELRELRIEQSRLERLQKALAPARQREELLQARTAMGQVLNIPAEFSSRRLAVQERLATLEAQRQRLELQLRETSDRLDALVLSPTLPAAAPALESANREVGNIRKALLDRSAHEGTQRERRNKLKAQLLELQLSVELDALESLRPSAAVRARIRELAHQHEALVQARTAAVVEAEARASALEQARQTLSQLAPIRAVEALKADLERLRQDGNIEEIVKQKQGIVAQIDREITPALARLGLFSGTLDALALLPIPSRETIERFDGRSQDLEQQLKAAHREVLELQRRLADADASLERLRLAGEVPQEPQLFAARAQRDATWQALRRSAVDGVEPLGATQDRLLADRLDEELEVADALADRLRREAERVAQRAQLEADAARVRRELETATGVLSRLETDRQNHEHDWSNLWKNIGIISLSPREMRAWYDRCMQLLEFARSRARAEGELQEATARLGLVRGQLEKILEAEGVEVSPALSCSNLLNRLAGFVGQVEEHNRVRRSRQEQLERDEQQLGGIQRKVVETSAALEAWRDAWGPAVLPLKLSTDVSPRVAMELLERWDELFKLYDEFVGMDKRIWAMNKQLEEFRTSVAPLVSLLEPPLLLPEEVRAGSEERLCQVIETLHRQLGEDRLRRTEAATLEKQRQQQTLQLQELRVAQEQQQRLLDSLCREAGGVTPEALPELEQRAEVLRNLQTKIQALEDQLFTLADGSALEELLLQLQGLETVSLQRQALATAERIQALEAQRSEVEQTIGREEEVRRSVDGNGSAAEKAEAIQAALAELRRESEQYARVRLAAELLRREIERFRQKHQGPLLGVAERIFCRLTLGAYQGLKADYNEKDEPVLEGSRQGRRVPIPAMSEGTRDQLYLSLRLASLMQHLMQNEPLPLVVDDILIHFDDHRAISTLEVLGELSRQTQVLIFTHHEHLLGLAERAIPSSQCFIHRLS